jgi:hypothetical protein
VLRCVSLGLFVSLLLGGCEGSILTSSKQAPETETGAAGGSGVITPESKGNVCKPRPQNIPKLLRLSTHEYQTIMSDVMGVPLPASLFTRWTPVAQVYGFDTMSETRIDEQGLEEQLTTAQSLAALVLATPALTAHCPAMLPAQTPRKQAWTWSSCVEPLVKRLASRSFRRPVRADELADYQSLFTTSLQGATTAGFGEPVDEALSAVLQAVFLSPNVVFKPEFVPGGLEPSEHGYGVASRLGLSFRSSIADDTLWALAGAGELSSADAVRAQANRLLDENRDRFTHNFGGQWLDFRDTNITGSLGPSMKKESHDVFAAIVQADLPVERLLRPGFTVVDAPLAQHYGLNVSGMSPTFRVATSERGGVLSQGGFLVSTATGSDFGRAIHRGIWVLQRVLCRPLPKLDAATLEEIGNSFNAIDRTLPLPEQMKIHRDSANRCGGCHNSIDPVGLSLEKYDAFGKWRTTYPNGAPIVTNLELDGRIVRDPHELAQAIETNPDYRTCVAEKLFTFGLNRGPQEDEACVMEALGRPKNGIMPGLKTMTVEALMKAMELTEVTP